MNKFRQILLVFAGVAIGACVQRVSPISSVSNARAAPAHQCDYTYIKDANEPNIGESGRIEYDHDWQVVLADGWKLKFVTGFVYIFERCPSPGNGAGT